MKKTNAFQVVQEADQFFYLRRKFTSFGSEKWLWHKRVVVYADGLRVERFRAGTLELAVDEARMIVRDENFPEKISEFFVDERGDIMGEPPKERKKR
jgi:hypothetical protein